MPSQRVRPVGLARSDGRPEADSIVPCSIVTSEQARANLRQGTRAAERASAIPRGDQPTPMEHALNQARRT